MMKGSIVALVTPFNEDNEVDYKTIEKLCQFHLENNTDGLLLLGTTAEAEALTNDEKVKIVDLIYKTVYPKIKIMVGIISNITEHVVEMSKLFENYDIDSFLVINPYYNKSNESGLLKHFTYIADNVSKPIILYNVPKRTGMSIPFEVVKALSHHNNIIGIKDASGDLSLQYKIGRLGNGFMYYCGDDNLLIPSIALGASGVISVIGNAFPNEIKLICKSFNKNSEIANFTYNKLYDLIEVMYNEVSPIGIKYIMSLQGSIYLSYRRPLDYPSRNLKRLIEEKLLEIIE